MPHVRAPSLQAPGEPSQLDLFWSATAEAFLREVTRASRTAGLLRDALTHGFPRLQALMESTLTRCACDSDVPAVPSAAQPRHREAMQRCLAPVQEAFLAGSVARLQEAVSALYPPSGRALPPLSAVQQCIACALLLYPTPALKSTRV